MAKKFNISAVIDLEDKLSGSLAKVSKKLTASAAKVSFSFKKLGDTSFNKMNKSLAKVVRKVSKLGSKLKKISKIVIGAGIGSAIAGGYALNRMVNSSAEVEVQREQILFNEGGDKSKADAVVKAIAEFGKTTKFNEKKITEAYIGLSVAFDKPMKAIDALTNVAARFNKPLDEIQDKFLQAAAGEFGELKRFGVRSKIVKGTDGHRLVDYKTSSGEDKQIILTKDLVKNQKLLVKMFGQIGAGGNKASLGTYSTAISNFWGAIDRLRDRFMLSGGVLQAFKEKVLGITGKIDSGKLGQKIQELGQKFSKWIKDINIDELWVSLKGAFNKFTTALSNIIPMLESIGDFSQKYFVEAIHKTSHKTSHKTPQNVKIKQSSFPAYRAKDQYHAKPDSKGNYDDLPPINIEVRNEGGKTLVGVSKGNKKVKKVGSNTGNLSHQFNAL